ncbi:RNA polymerase sigma factor [Agrobacterium tumefaciens str. Kerr 14]|uniref:RNA polymerase sigma factor n=1 Tax=Agrobacterium tumefaciens str. Kerr 14 TaxID=1183424 RepID=A0A1S7SEV7_AGRTU|nr:sigma-70 family RNA polymerase sigma factor [Agrobacterium tumefaciens]CUX68093.1 RNA polymerase sigma factor [Agrobacterium tumefaciens str. Kerr 14]
MCRNAQIEAELLELLPALHKFARRFYSSQNDVDDLVQDTLVKVLGNLEKFEEGTRLKSWMFTIMRNTFCTRFGLSKREHVGMDDVLGQKATVQPQQEWSLRGQELEEAIAALPKPSRDAINVVFIQGESYEEAAKRFGCPIGTVKSRVNRARERLTERLDSE